MTTTTTAPAPDSPAPDSPGLDSPDLDVQGPDVSGPVVDEGPVEAAALRVQAQQRLDEAARVAKTGDRLSLALWAVAAMALLFTMANVTTFAVEHDTPWWIGWLLDPMASLALLVVLIGDGVLARHGQRSGGWARLLKHGSAAATWSMNAWTSVVAQDLAGIVLHSVPPALVIGLSEATPGYRARFAELAERLTGEAVTLRARADQLSAAHREALSLARAAARTLDAPAVPVTPSPDPDPAPVRTPARTLSEESGPRTPARTLARTLGEGSAHRTQERTPVQGSGGRRTEEELLGLVLEAIAAGRLPAQPSGTAIQRELGGGKGPATRVSQRLAAGQDVAGESPDGDAAVIQLVHDRAEAAS